MQKYCRRIGGEAGMKKINVRFEQDSSLDTIEVTVRAAGRDEYVEELLSKLAYDPTLITVSDENGVVKTISPDEIYSPSIAMPARF